jgi:hypothetical protein
MKIEKISSRVLLVCIILILVSFGAFLTIGYDNMVGDHNQPILTDVILCLMYGLTIVTAGLVVWSVVQSAQNSKGSDSSATTGVPGGKIALFTICLTIVSFIVGWVLGLGETNFTASDGSVTTAGWVTVVDMFCTSIAILFVAAAIAVVVSMTGILTKSASK